MTELVIDANVLGSAGNAADYPQSVKCRDFLMKVLNESKHNVLTCEKLLEEYNKHQSNIGRSWRLSMLRQGRIRKIIIDTSIVDSRIDGIAEASDNQRFEAKKDTHLVVMAGEDKIIISNEKNSKNIFILYMTSIPEFRKIVWLSPVEQWEECIEAIHPTCNLYRFYLNP